MIYGYVLMRFLIFPLMDEVWIDEDQIVIKNREEEDSFPLQNIVNVESSIRLNPERIILTLREPCKFGSRITFEPPFRWWRFTKHPLAAELMAKVQQVEA